LQVSDPSAVRSLAKDRERAAFGLSVKFVKMVTGFGNSSTIDSRVPEMLSEATAAQLSARTYRCDAKRRFCLLPLGGIYWEDEIPDLRQLWKLPEEDRNQIYRLFGIRYRIWKGASLHEDDQLFWETARSQVPDWALFQRVKVSPADQLAQDQTERIAKEEFEALLAEADQVTVSEKYPGVEAFSATFDLTKSVTANRKSWWKRIFNRGA
jgi:hypothetical protein